MKIPGARFSFRGYTEDQLHGFIIAAKHGGYDGVIEELGRIRFAFRQLIEGAISALPGLRYLAEKEPENYGPDLDCLERALVIAKVLKEKQK